MSDLPNVR